MASRRLFDGAQAELGILPIKITGIIYNVSVLGALTVLDGFSATAVFSTSATDGITAADPFSGLATATRTVTDSITGLDNLNRFLSFNLTATDSISGSDNFNGDVDTPGVVTGSVTDSLGAADTIAVQWTSNASVTGSITALDAGSSGGTVSASVSAFVTAGGAFNGFLSSGIVFNTSIFDAVFSTDELTVEYFSGEDPNLKLSLAPILSLYRSAERLNSNFEAIQEAFQNTLSRDGSEPNNMLDDMDMDSHRITNLGAPVDDNDAVRLIDLTTLGGGGGGGGTVSLPTDLTLTRTATTATVVSSTGADATIPAADATNAGLMTAADRTKLTGVETGATADMTGSEIVSAINTFLGSTTWQGGGGTGGSTNLSFSRTGTSVTVLSDTGTDAVLPVADSTNAGVMSAADKIKLDGITGGGGGATNLTFSRTLDSVTVLSDTGTDAVLPEATNLLAGVFSGTAKAKLDGVDTGATTNQVNFVNRFGGVGDNATNNDAAIALAEASAFENIYLPEGNYLSTVNRTALTKKYIGPGKIILNAFGRKGYQGMSVYSTEVPSSASTGEYGTNEKMTFSDFDFRIITEGTRRNLERYLVSGGNPAGFPKYFWAPSTPKMSVFRNDGGWSGTSGVLASPAAAGATTAVLQGSVSDWGARGLLNKQIGFSDLLVTGGNQSDPTPTDFVTVTGASGSTITFTPALTQSYPAGSNVTHGYRTMNTHELKIVDHNGGGDAYAYCARITVGYPALNSQLNTFHNATGGIIGGDITLTQDGNYATGWECIYNDSNKDGAIIGSVNSYARQNNTATRANSMWLHDLAKMEGGGTAYGNYGLKPIDGVWVAGVAARTGLDFTQSRFSVAAVALPLGERIGFDATMPNTPGSSNGWGYVADNINNMFIRGNSDAGGKFLAINNGGAAVVVRPTAVQINKPVDVQDQWFQGARYKITDSAGATVKGDIAAGTDGNGDYIDIFAGSTYRLRIRDNGTLSFNASINAATFMNAGSSISVGAADPKVIFIQGSGVYIWWDGSNLRATKNNGASSVVIV